MEIEDIISLVTNVGFPVTLCFILIRYMLDTVGEKLENWMLRCICSQGPFNRWKKRRMI